MADGLIRVPPDSTGKRIRHTDRHDIAVNNIQSAVFNALEIGDTITGLTSGVTGTYTGQKTDAIDTLIFLKEVNGTFTIGETLQKAGANVATVVSQVELFTPAVSIVDPNSPFNRQKVTDDGEAIIAYEGGSFSFDAFGHAIVTPLTKIAEYTFIYHNDTSLFYDKLVGAGSGSHNAQASTYKLSVDNVSGSLASRTTHRYFSYEPGVGNQLTYTVQLGDTGKAGCVRRWGFYDDEDGLFFQLSGSALSVGVRSNVTGTPTDNVVTQTEFNGEALDDAVLSRFLLDVSKFNIYWIDYQWLGAGRARFGVYAPDGTKVTMHTFEHPNQYNVLYMTRGTLPVRWEVFNETATSGTSELTMACVSIQRQSNEITYPGKKFTYRTPAPVAVSGSQFVPLFSARPKTTLHGVTNRITTIPEDVEFVVNGDPIIVEVVANANLSGSTFAYSAGTHSSVDIDQTAASFTGGTVRENIFAQSGVTLRPLDEDEGLENALSLSADGVSQPIFTIAAKTADPSGSADVTMLIRWKEAY